MSIGRLLFMFVSNGDGGGEGDGGGGNNVHDLYTMAAGLYFCWLLSKIFVVTHEWFQKGWNYMCKVRGFYIIVP